MFSISNLKVLYYFPFPAKGRLYNCILCWSSNGYRVRVEFIEAIAVENNSLLFIAIYVV